MGEVTEPLMRWERSRGSGQWEAGRDRLLLEWRVMSCMGKWGLQMAST